MLQHLLVYGGVRHFMITIIIDYGLSLTSCQRGENESWLTSFIHKTLCKKVCGCESTSALFSLFGFLQVRFYLEL